MTNLCADPVDAHNLLVTENLRLVHRIAKRYYPDGRGMGFDDVMQEGRIGLILAAKTFDASKGYRFSTWAFWWIRSCIQREISRHGSAIHVTQRAYMDSYNIDRVIGKYQAKNGRDPSVDEIASAIDMSKRRVRDNLRHRVAGIHSLDEPARESPSGERGLCRVDRIPDDNPTQDESFLLEEQKELFISAVRSLGTQIERVVIMMRFGLDGYSLHTLKETGEKLGYTKERIRQIQRSGLLKIRRIIQRQCQ